MAEREVEPDEVPSEEGLDVEGPNEGATGDNPEQDDSTDEAKAKVRALEDDPPEKLDDWPEDEAKYETFGGPEGTHSYAEGPEAKLGPPDVRHHEDGRVSVEGEEVDDPDEYKGDPIPGGPTDPNAN